MKYMGSLYAIDDKERTIAFYKEVCGLRVIQDFGTNFTMTGGICFQTRESWSGFLDKEPNDITYGGNDAEHGDSGGYVSMIRISISLKSANHCLLWSNA